MNKKQIEFFMDIFGLNDSDVIEVRIFDNNGKYNPISKYATNIKELNNIINNFSKYRWNLYYGINKRDKVGSRLNDNVPFRELFYFDIEAIGDKPMLSNRNYINKINDTLNYITTKFKVKYNVHPAAIIKSGRGVHLYYKIHKLPNLKYKKQFRIWFKNIQNEFMINRPHKDIKFTDSVFDGARIAGLPGSINTKYNELPIRDIAYMNKDNIFDLEPILKNIKINNAKIIKISDLYDDKDIRNCPEYKILTRYNNLPEGQLHIHIIFALKLLLRDNKISQDIIDDIQNELLDLNYNVSDFTLPDNTYVYTTKILNNWCLNNYKWCIDNNVKLPYKFSKGIKRNIVKLTGNIYYPDYEIKDYNTLISYIKGFNNQFMVVNNDSVGIYYDYLFDKLSKCCNPKLWKFILDNNLFNQICSLT